MKSFLSAANIAFIMLILSGSIDYDAGKVKICAFTEFC